MNKAKKIFAIIMSVFMLTWAFVGCPNVDNGTDDDSTTGSSSTNPGSDTNPGSNTGKIASLQAQIDSTPAGGTVDLSLAADDTTEAIKITKPITVNAAKVGKGLKVEVAHNISSNVGLKGFQSGSSLKIASSTLATVGRGAVENENADTFKKYGDGALPLFLDDCKFDKFESESDVAVYFEGEKSVIDELEIKKGENRKDFEGNAITEDVKFTFIDMGEKQEDLSYIKEMFVDKDVCDVNLIGGKFDEVKFDPAAEMNFKFDGEFDQFADAKFIYGEKTEDFSNKTFDKEFWDDTTFWGNKFDVKDITVAEKDLEGSATGVYKYTMTKEQFKYLDGGVSIIFLTEDQETALDENPSDSPVVWAAISPATPAYTMSLMGTFEADSSADGVHAIHGTESHYMVNGLRNNCWTYQQVYLDEYQHYSKDAVVVDIGENEVTYYVNAAAIRKSDLLIGAYPSDNGHGLAGAGSKLAMIDLSQYKPYFVIDTKKLELLKCRDYLQFNGKMWETKPGQESQYNDAQADMLAKLDNDFNFRGEFEMFFPMDPDSGFFEFGQPYYRVFSMDDAEAEAYPTEVEYVPAPVPDNAMGRNMVDVYYWRNNAWSAPERVVLGTIDPWMDDWYYFTSQQCTDESYFSVAASWENYGNIGFIYPEQFPPEGRPYNGVFATYQGKFYAKPKEKINLFVVGLDGNPMTMTQTVTLNNGEQPVQFSYSDDGSASMNLEVTSKREVINSYSNPDPFSAPKYYYKTCDWSKAINEGRFSDPITEKSGKFDLDSLKEGDTLYVVSPYVILKAVNGSTITDAGKVATINFMNESLCDIEAFDELNWYKDAELTTKWTKAELKDKVEAEVFFKKEVIVYNTASDTTGTPVAYDTFVSNIEDGQTYYSDPDFKNSKIIIVPEINPMDPDPAPVPTGTSLEAFANPVKVGMAVKAYKELSDIGKDRIGLTILVSANNPLGADPSDPSSYGSVTWALACMTKGKGYDLFSDEARTSANKLTTREQLEALDFGATIYATYKGKTFNSYQISDNGQVSDTSSSITEDNLLEVITMDMSGFDIWTYYYKNPDKTEPITTADDIATLKTNNIDNIYVFYSEPLINVDTGSGILQKKKSEIINLMYVETSNVVPFGGKAYRDSLDFTAQYLFYSDSEKTQPFSSGDDINGLSGNTTIYAEKLNNVIIVGGLTAITLPDSAIEKYFAAGAHFYPNASMTDGTQFDSTADINTAFETSGKIYLNENILVNQLNDQSPNPDYFVVTVYEFNSEANNFKAPVTMFRPACQDTYMFGVTTGTYSYYSDEACENALGSNEPGNGATIYVKVNP